MPLVVLLRGINVGGHRRFRPAALAEQLHHLDAVNIGAAGTFVIRRPVTRTRLRAEMSGRLPRGTRIMICDAREIARVAAGNHFARQPRRQDVVRFVSLLARQPRLTPCTPLRLPASGRWMLQILAREGRFVVGRYRREMRSIRYLGMLDEIFGAPATTRSWSTLTAVTRVLASETPFDR